VEAVMYPTRRRLIEDGYTYEEADAVLDNYAEDQLQDQRDREVEEYFQQQGESR
jgi:hypothetical protein